MGLGVGGRLLIVGAVGLAAALVPMLRLEGGLRAVLCLWLESVTILSYFRLPDPSILVLMGLIVMLSGTGKLLGSGRLLLMSCNWWLSVELPLCVITRLLTLCIGVRLVWTL